jgi:hypothetical protein
MIKEAIRVFYEDYYSSVAFRKWQNDLSSEIYKSLRTSGNDEDDKTTNLCKAMTKQHKGLNMQNRTSSYCLCVKFEHNGKIYKRELADMIIISVVTLNKEIALLKTAFVQNKKSKLNPDQWTIEQGQLLFLNSIPAFSECYIMFEKQPITFHNYSKTLGNYVLFRSNHDMMLLTAKNIFCSQQEKDIIINNNGNKKTNRYIDLSDIEKGIFISKINSTKYTSHPSDCLFNTDLPFFGNCEYALNTQEFVRELTFFNIGESSNVFGNVVDENLYNYTAKIIQSSFGFSITDNYFKQENNLIKESNHHIILIHLELGVKYI